MAFSEYINFNNTKDKKTTKFRLVEISDNFPSSECDFFFELHKYMDVIRKINTFLETLSITE